MKFVKINPEKSIEPLGINNGQFMPKSNICKTTGINITIIECDKYSKNFHSSCLDLPVIKISRSTWLFLALC
ncbi:Zinc finger, FYVE/PHD-type,Zinc finger, RING/FYVE/PHD-type [Cinara cedri]|uniref:Zinc finger, FYVE/PHD-type,Zinc finger, RING/FYVE/PHD-type n=1 Tax=Cinara cedri TaxID=506608 RepID=A0A5E4MQF5_9HEMI|nr:Zinc finger, FYVE/PHD-type,Zinc finger, RING/FYVE/PHD-type [Cinara cedri]